MLVDMVGACPSTSRRRMGKSHPAAWLWEPEIEKILIVKSKCHRLGEDPEALKIDRSMQEGWVGRGRGQSEG